VTTVPEAPTTFDTALAQVENGVPDADAYERLASLTTDHPFIAQLNGLDPFSVGYRELAMRLYRELGQRTADYQHTAMPTNIWTELPPWSFQRSGLLSEFFISWGQIFRLLDLSEGGRVLEYGCGTGQLLMFLARAGMRPYGVDIDPSGLEIARRQAELLGLPVELECAAFGEGFVGERFERIIFFEAFHHAWDFESLLSRLHDRLTPSGRIIFCGEPIVPESIGSIPFPWGPRLDALSVFCMRRWGWMELGFQHDFFVRALQRTGWRVAFHPVPGCGRAAAYVAESARLGTTKLGEPVELGRFAAGWDEPEGTHRWTRSGTAFYPLPRPLGIDTMDVVVRVSNFLPFEKHLTVACGKQMLSVDLRPGEVGRAILLQRCTASDLEIRCDGHRPADLIEGSVDTRYLGIAVHEVEVRTSDDADVPYD
jgi:2-polyprenyl-3-methyl-5-hydroxy-6-metoxy-1,4-benzoquinol methylase